LAKIAWSVGGSSLTQDESFFLVSSDVYRRTRHEIMPVKDGERSLNEGGGKINRLMKSESPAWFLVSGGKSIFRFFPRSSTSKETVDVSPLMKMH
jgi:hypothetical protein